MPASIRVELNDPDHPARRDGNGIAAEPPSRTIELWPEGAPGATGKTDEDKPAITVSLPDPARNTGAAVLICPGGGFMTRAVDHEGVLIANWFKARGVAGFILRYRIGPIYARNVSIQDAQRGIRYVRVARRRFRNRSQADRHHRLLGRRDARVQRRSESGGGHVRRERPDRPGIEPALPSRFLPTAQQALADPRGPRRSGRTRPRSRRSPTGKPRRRPSSSAPRKMRI